jgi:hypothetical protein
MQELLGECRGHCEKFRQEAEVAHKMVADYVEKRQEKEDELYVKVCILPDPVCGCIPGLLVCEGCCIIGLLVKMGAGWCLIYAKMGLSEVVASHHWTYTVCDNCLVRFHLAASCCSSCVALLSKGKT